MRFQQTNYRRPPTQPGTCWLKVDNWDDFGHRTLFHAVYDSESGDRFDLGAVKIAGLDASGSYMAVPDAFERLDEHFFSLGQDQAYYETLVLLPAITRAEYLLAVRDLVADAPRGQAVQSTKVYEESLTRFVSSSAIATFRRILGGDGTLSGFGFEYKMRAFGSPTLEFGIEVDAYPPANVHVLIGRNGVGKTSILVDMIGQLLDIETGAPQRGVLEHSGGGPLDELFNGLTSVSFSAFDSFAPPETVGMAGIRYGYIGLQRHTSDQAVKGPKSLEELGLDFVNAIETCVSSSRRDAWLEAVDALSSDPGFAALGLRELLDAPRNNLARLADQIFCQASSGHKIVLSTMSQLVSTVDDRWLVLIDEPEAHLHPPLMASFVKALSGLMTDRNAVAIVATHSPVFLQEVPRSCVSMIFRTGDAIQVDRPAIETYAENLGILTREVFQLEVTASGHHARIAEACETADSLDDVLRTFGGALGSEGRAIARSILNSR